MSRDKKIHQMDVSPGVVITKKNDIWGSAVFRPYIKRSLVKLAQAKDGEEKILHMGNFS